MVIGMSAMKLRPPWTLWAVLLWQSTGAYCGNAVATPKQDYWMGIYYNQSKIGSLHITVNEDKVDGKIRLRKTEALRIRYRKPAENVIYNSTRNIYTDTAFTPTSESVTTEYQDSSTSGWHTETVETTYGLSSVKVKTTADGAASEQTQPFMEEDHTLLTAGTVTT